MLATGIDIRDLRPDHWPEVARIYAEGIATGNATFETDMPSWEVWDGVHLHHPRLVGTVANEVVAWAAVLPISTRPVYSGVAETSLYVGEKARGQVLGTELLGALVREADAAGIATFETRVCRETARSGRPFTRM